MTVLGFAQTWMALGEQHADRRALSYGAASWTYDALARQIDRLAEDLRGYAGRAFWFAPRNDPPSVALILAALHAGAVPILADPAWNDVEQSKIRARDGVHIAIAVKPNWAAARADSGWRLDDDFKIQEVAARPPPRLRSDTVLGRFTSGSTSLPRCLQFPWSSVLAAANGWRRAVSLGPADRVFCLATLNNGLGFNTSFLSVFLAGGELVLNPARTILRAAIKRVFEQSDPTVLVAFPFAYQVLMNSGQSVRTDHLRCAISSAAKLDLPVQEHWRARGLPICNYYGLAEVGPVTCNLAGDADSLGTPLPHSQVLVTDQETKPVASRDAGVVRVKTSSMASDYLDADEPAFGSRVDENGFYVTGDRARRTEDGRLVLLGRVDALVNVNGRKIQPQEVEGVIQELGGVDGVVVRGEEQAGKTAIVAYVESSVVSEQEILRHCIERLAGYKVPHIVRVCAAFPRSSSGKVSLGQMSTWAEEVRR